MSRSPEYWRGQRERYMMFGNECDCCNTKLFPQKAICSRCEMPLTSEYEFSGKGKIYSYTTIYNPPNDFRFQVPYTVALIELEEGPLVLSQLTEFDQDKIMIGVEVEMVTRKLFQEGEEGVVVYGYKFRPLTNKNHNSY